MVENMKKSGKNGGNSPIFPIFLPNFAVKIPKSPIFRPYFSEKNSHISHIFSKKIIGWPVRAYQARSSRRNEKAGQTEARQATVAQSMRNLRADETAEQTETRRAADAQSHRD